MYGCYDGIKVSGIQAVVPSRVIDNHDVIERYGLGKAQNYISRTGVEQRRIVYEGQTATDLSTRAASELMAKLNWDADQIRAIVNVSRSAELLSPSMAMIIQKRLGIGDDCIAFDVNLGCTAYVSGLQIISSILSNTGGKGILLTGYGINPSEKPENRNQLLFGHASSATAIEMSAGNRLLYSQKTDGNRYQYIYSTIKGNSVMDGNAVLMFAMSDVCDSISEFKEHFSLQESDIDYYILHQAQKLIVDGIIDEAHLPREKVPTSYEKFGNTNTSTIPLTMCLHSDTLQRKGTIGIMMCGYGVGLAWSNVYVSIDSNVVFPLIETSITYNDIMD